MLPSQLQPAPVIETSHRLAGSCSVTRTTPLDAPGPLLCTVRVYRALTWPGTNLPSCRFSTVRSPEIAEIADWSEALLLLLVVSPPPLTMATFFTDASAVDETVTARVMG